MEKARVRELMALADAQFDAWWHDHGDAITDDVEGLCARAWSAAILAARARLESALRQEPQGGMSEELPPLPEPVSNLHGDVFSPNQMRDYARRAILAAAGGRK